MNLKKAKFLILMLISLMLLSGCTATYNLEIYGNNINEKVSIHSTAIDVSEYFVPAYHNSISNDEYDVDANQKIDGVTYYNTNFSSEEANFSYKFNNNDFSNSNIINSFFSSFVFDRYDHDEDGEEDYYILSTSNDFKGFKLYNDLEKVTIKIKNNYEVISNNADEINKNIYIWHFTRDNIKSINMVYNQDRIIDYRTLFEKILEGDYVNIFTLSLIIGVIGFIVYKLIKNKSKKVNEI